MKNKHISFKKVVVARITPSGMRYINGGGSTRPPKYTSVPTTSSQSQNIGNCDQTDPFQMTRR